MKVIDNFLEENDFIKIQNKFLSETCKWEWSNVVENDNSFYNFQFVHGVYLPTVLLKKGYDPEDIFRKITIQEMPDIKPLLESLKTSAIIKIKVNLTTKTPTIIEHGFHIDHFFPKAKTAILYLNTCDGYTLFSNGDKVESVKNRIVIFDSNIPHTGTTVTNQQRRGVLNINYYPNPAD